MLTRPGGGSRVRGMDRRGREPLEFFIDIVSALVLGAAVLILFGGAR